MTLPMIVALSNAGKQEKAYLKAALANYKEDRDLFRRVYNIIEKNHGFEYTKKKAESFANRALRLLDGLPQSLELEELRKFTRTVAKRKS